jgi:hypothetical protein
MPILPFIFTSARHAMRIFDQSHFIHSLNCVLLKSLGPLHSGRVGRPVHPATVSAQLAQIAGPSRLQLTIVPSANVEL